MKDRVDLICQQMMSLPLFLGMSSNDISNLLTTFPIAYHVYGDGKVVAQADTACNSLIFLVRGKMRVSTTADDHGYTIEELFEAPNVVQPERLFGISPRYTRTFTTAGQCAVMCIAKNDVVKLSATYDIFRINLLNLFSTQAQRLARIPWRHVNGSRRARIIHFISSRCLLPTGHKTVKIMKSRLAHMLNDSPRAVAAELRQMEADGQIMLKRETIEVEALEKLSFSQRA
ncbi:MAG: Crp/Fnr family transcriptional regulator [Prevotella sp.]|nr:Crp/Fnr family transcriptional regulator [Prevotella sp.]